MATGRPVHDLAGGGRPIGEQRDIVMVEAGKQRPQLLDATGTGQGITVGTDGQHEALGHRDALGRSNGTELA
jgi:hypothetical protein